jgi:hypothetical protein
MRKIRATEPADWEVGGSLDRPTAVWGRLTGWAEKPGLWPGHCKIWLSPAGLGTAGPRPAGVGEDGGSGTAGWQRAESPGWGAL